MKSLVNNSHIKRCRKYLKEHLNEFKQGDYVAIYDGEVLSVKYLFEEVLSDVENILKERKFKNKPHIMKIGKDTSITSIRIK